MGADGWRCGGVRKEFAGRRDGQDCGTRVISRSLKNEKNYSVVDYTIWTMNQGTVSKFDELPTAYVLLLKKNVGAEGFPEATCWEQASAIRFERDWRGEQADPQRATEVRLLWNAQTLFFAVFCAVSGVACVSRCAGGWVARRIVGARRGGGVSSATGCKQRAGVHRIGSEPERVLD